MPVYNLAINVGGKANTKHIEDTNKRLDAFGKTAKRIAMAGGMAAIGSQVIKLGGNMLKAASDVEETQSKFNTVFGELAGQTTTELQTFADAANRSIYDLQGFAATLQDTFVPLGFARDEAAKTSIELVKLAEDLASFNNLDTDMVVQDLQSALVGNTETLRKYGVVATQAAIDQEALALGMEFTKGKMDAQTKAAAILSITMKSTTDAQGDAIKTADSYANQLKGLEAAQQELNVALGTIFLPIAGDVVSKLTEFAKGGAEGTKAITDMTKAADESAKANLEAAEAAQNWNDYGRRLSDTLTSNTDLAFQLFGGTRKVTDEMTKVAAASGDYSGSNEQLAKSLEEVFGAQVQVDGKYISIAGHVIATTDDLRVMNEEYRRQNELLTASSDELAAYDAKLIGLESTAIDVQAAITKTSQSFGDAGTSVDIYARAGQESAAISEHQANQFQYMRDQAAEAAKVVEDELAEAVKAEAEAEERLTAQTAAFFKSLNNETLAEYNDILGKTTETSVKVAGRTSEQEGALRDLQEEYEKVQGSISDYQYGVESVGLSEDERNEKIAEQQTRLAELQAAMDPLVSIQNEYATVTQGGTINQQLLNEKIFEGIQASTDNAASLAIAGEALGIYTAEQAEAKLQAALLDEQIRRQIEAWDGTAAGIDEVRSNILGYINELNNIPSEIKTTVTTSYVTEGSPTSAAGGVQSGGDYKGGTGKEGAAGFASGGFPPVGVSSRVGEGNKPELYRQGGQLYMIPGERGQVFSNQQSQGMMGGNTIENIQITVQAGGSRFNAQAVGQQIAASVSEELGKLS